MSREICGFVLIMWVIANGIAWLFGFDLSTKDKIIIPNAIIIAMIVIVAGLKLMGVE